MAITGGFVSALGIFLSTFSPNLDVMIILYGFVGGKDSFIFIKCCSDGND